MAIEGIRERPQIIDSHDTSPSGCGDAILSYGQTPDRQIGPAISTAAAMAMIGQ
jgi:hypothetical protein